MTENEKTFDESLTELEKIVEKLTSVGAKIEIEDI